MTHKEYMRYLEMRRHEIEQAGRTPGTNFDLEKEQAKIKKDQEMFDQYMKDSFSFKGWFPILSQIPVPWLIVGGVCLLVGVISLIV